MKFYINFVILFYFQKLIFIVVMYFHLDVFKNDKFNCVSLMQFFFLSIILISKANVRCYAMILIEKITYLNEDNRVQK